MIRYRYAEEPTPPAPFATISVRCPESNRNAVDLPAQIDTAADRTVLPDTVVQALSLVEDGRLNFQGFAGDVIELPVYLVEIRIGTLDPVLVRAAHGPAEPYVLLGRDVINRHDLVLQGPKRMLEVSPGSES